MASPSEPKLGYDTDLVGQLSAHLRDLTGFTALASELVQNADDAPDARRISFDVTEKALLVSNDGVFSRCSDIAAPRCELEDAGEGRCDLHSFRKYAGQAKRDRDGTTGAFGIGFTVAYQVTDRPEMISAGEHWTLRPEFDDPLERLVACNGCSVCEGVDGTLFRLPWAATRTDLRRGLGLPPVTTKMRDELLKTLMQTLPTMGLFLNRLESLEVRHKGRIRERAIHRRSSGQLTVETRALSRDFAILHGDFDDRASDLREEYGDSIEKSRSASVLVAIPKDSSMDRGGLLYATLPTEQETPLTLHCNADFFPKSDRKSLVLDGGYQQEWNEAALEACAASLAQNLEDLAGELGHRRLWELIASVHRVEEISHDSRLENALAPFWERITDGGADARIMWTAQGSWCSPAESVYLEDESEYAAGTLKLLEDLGFRVAHRDLHRSLHPEIREALGVQTLDLEQLVGRLEASGLVDGCAPGDIEALRVRGRLRTLWLELELLASRSDDPGSVLAASASGPGRDGRLREWRTLYKPDGEQTAVLFEDHCQVLATKRIKGCSELLSLVRPLDEEAALATLEEADQLGDPDGLLAWFDRRRDTFQDREETLERIANLPIFRTADDQHAPLGDLRLPSGFRDPIGVAELVADDTVAAHRAFLGKLGAEELDLRTFLTMYVPRGLERHANPPWLPELYRLILEHLSELDATALRSLEIVPDKTGILGRADEMYLASEAIATVLGDDARIADVEGLPPGSQEVLEFLGARAQPAPSDVTARVLRLTQDPPTPETRDQIRRIVAYLAGEMRPSAFRWSDFFERLSGESWLPAQGTRARWFAAPELYPPFVAQLIGGEAEVIDVPQRDLPRELMDALGLESQPPPELVVDNLLSLARSERDVHQDVYRFLDEHADSPALASLRGQRCLQLDRAWASPDQVYWEDHGFGGWRHKLAPSWQRWRRFLDAIGVQERPDHRDAFAVLLELAESLGEDQVSPDDAEVVWECWRVITTSLADAAIGPEEVHSKVGGHAVVIERSGRLTIPRYVFLEDSAGLVDQFDAEIATAVIQPPPGCREALVAAGVRGLRASATCKIRNGGKRVTSPALAEALENQEGPIARAAEAALGSASVAKVVDRLRSVKAQEAASLEVRWVLEHPAGRDQTAWAPTSAIYDSKGHILAVVDPTDPDLAMARELAYCLHPEGTNAAMASFLDHVLKSRSTEESNQRLDELGVPPLQTDLPESREGDSAAFGGEEDSAGSGTENGQGVSATEEEDDSGQPGQLSSDTDGSPRGPVQRQDASSGDVQGTGEPGTTSPAHGDGKGPETSTSSQATRETEPSGLWHLIVSYEPETADGSRKENGQHSGRRSEIEHAGVRRVLQHEKQAGRVPVEMQPGNEGYDVESYDEEGRLLRLIEVKSLAGDWGRGGFPKLTPAQFRKAQEKRELYWVYVVEQAESDKFRMTRIQDPVAAATRYAFDTGWRKRAEAEGGGAG